MDESGREEEVLKIRWNVSWLFGVLLGIGAVLTLVLPGDVPWRAAEAELFRAAVRENALPTCRHCPWRLQHGFRMLP